MAWLLIPVLGLSLFVGSIIFFECAEPPAIGVVCEHPDSPQCKGLIQQSE